MARVTAEDCILRVPNKFRLVLLASRVAKQIISGVTFDIDSDNDKPSVVALRIIANDLTNIPSLEEDLIRSQQATNIVDKIEEENLQAEEEEIDYSSNSSDIYVSEDHSDLNEPIFEDNEEDLE